MRHKYHINNLYADTPIYFGETRLWQIGRLYCKPSGGVVNHMQPEGLYELTVVTAGRGRIYSDDAFVNVRAGDIHLSLPKEFHEIVSEEEDPLNFDFFSFMTENESFRSALERITEENKDIGKRIFHSDSICDLVSRGIQEMNDGDKYSYEMMEGICCQIIISVIRSFEDRYHKDQQKLVTDADSLCYQVMGYIDSHIFSMRSLTEISDSMNYNYSYISNLFKKTTGQGLMDYYRGRRLDMAKRLLRESGRNVTQVADMLNYSSAYSFSRAFTAQYGISPKYYKKINCIDTPPNKDLKEI